MVRFATLLGLTLGVSLPVGHALAATVGNPVSVEVWASFAAPASITATQWQAPAAPSVGGPLSYVIVVNNTGIDTITDLTVVDTLGSSLGVSALLNGTTARPAGMSAAVVTSVPGSGTRYVWTGTGLSFGPGASWTFTIAGQAGIVCAPLAISNSAWIGATAPGGSAEVFVPATGGILSDPPGVVTLAAAMVGGGGVGSPVTFRVDVTNSGSATLTSLTVTDTVSPSLLNVTSIQPAPFGPASVPAAGGATVYGWSATGLSFAPGMTYSFSLTGNIGMVCVPTTVSATPMVYGGLACGSLNTTVGSAVGAVVQPPVWNLNVSNVMTGGGAPGSPVTYTITVLNAGTATVTGILVSDTLAPEIRNVVQGGPFTAQPVGASASGTVYAWYAASLPPGSPAAVLTLTGTVGEVCAAATIGNTAYWEATFPCVGLGLSTSNAATFTIPAPTVAINTGIGQSGPALVGSPSGYIITVSNAGTATLTSLTVTDTIPASLFVTGTTQPGGWAAPVVTSVPGTGTRYVWSNASLVLSPGALLTFNVNGNFGPVCANTPLDNRAYADGLAGCGTASSLSPSAPDTLLANTTIVSVTTWMAPAAPVSGGPVTYGITVRNLGTATISSLTVVDTIGTLVTLASTGQPAPFGPAVVAGAGTSASRFTWSSAALAFLPGQSFTFSVTGTVGVTGVGVTTGSTALASADVGCGPVSVATVGESFFTGPTVVLSATLFAAPLTVSTGQTFLVTMDVGNVGGGTGTNASATIWRDPPSTGGVSFSGVSAPATGSIPSGNRLVFSWTATALTAGVVGFGGTAYTAEDAHGPIYSPTVTIQNAANLSAGTMLALPGTACVGGSWLMAVQFNNTGGAAANNVSATVFQLAGAGGAAWSVPSPAGPVTIAGGSSQVFTFTVTGIAAGSVSLGVTVTGFDANSGASTFALGAPGAVVLDTPAVVGATFSFVPPTASTGQTVQARVVLANSGGSAAAIGPLATPQINAGAGSFSVPSAAGTTLQPAGISGSVYVATWNYTTTVTGTQGFTATGTGTTCGSTPVLAAADGSLTVVGAAVLSGTLIVSAPASGTQIIGGVVVVTLTVTNTGGANVSGLAPSPLSVLGSTTGPVFVIGSATAYLNAGAAATFVWTFTPTAIGLGGFQTIATGTDVNSAGSVNTGTQTAPVGSVLVVNPAALTSVVTTSGGGCAGQPVTVNLAVSNAANAAVATVTSVTLWNGAATPAPATWGMPSPGLPFNLGPGQSQVFVYTVTPSGAGNLTFSASAAGTDTVRAVTVTSPTGSAANVTVSSTALVAATFSFVPPTASTGQTVQARVVLANSGGSAASIGPLATPQINTGAGSFSVPSAAGTTLQPAGISGSVYVATWNYTTTVTGTQGFTATGTGTTCGATPVLAAADGSLTVVGAAVLSGTLIVTAPASGTQVVGSVVVVRLDVTNIGGANASGVTPAALAVLGGVGGAGPSLLGSATAYLNAGAAATFLWSFTPSGTGTAGFQTSASGTDVNSALGVGTGTVATPVSLLVVNPAALTSVVTTTGGGCAGQPVTVNVQVSNAANAAVATVQNLSQWNAAASPATAAVTGPVPALPFDLGPGQSQTFVYTSTPSTPGDLTYTASASGTDTVRALVVTSAPSTAANVTISSTAVITASLTFVPPAASTGQTVQVRLDLANGGGSPAAMAAASGPQFNTLAGVATPTGIGPVTLQPAGNAGSVYTATWNVTPASAGTYNLTATGTGTTCGAAAVVAPASGSFTAVAAASLSATLVVTVPSATVLVQGDLVVVQLTLVNSGSATARMASPGPLNPSLAGTLSAPRLLSATNFIAGGGSATWSWSFTVSGAGLLTFNAPSATSTDANSGAAVNAAAGTSGNWPLDVQGQAVLVATFDMPGSVVQGTPATATVWVSNLGGADLTVNNPIAISQVDPLSLIASKSGYSPTTPRVIPVGGAPVAFQWDYNTVLNCGVFWSTVFVSATENLTGRALGPVFLARMVGVTATSYSGIVALASPARAEVATDSLLTFTVYDTCSPPVAVSSVPIQLTVIGGDGFLNRTSGVTGGTGQVSATLRLGNTAGQNVVRADATGGGNPSTAVSVEGTIRSGHQDYLSSNLFDPSRGQALKIRAFVPAACRVSARIFNLAGELVRTVHDQPMPAGVVVWDWDGRNDGGQFVGNGTYFIQVVAGKDVQIKRVIVLQR